ncbi:MAG: putative 3-methyladenine glycosylase [Chlamydiia bacterium]|nr:putative 3-methyladenine glycosylase [Chlamydiia bacterium]
MVPPIGRDYYLNEDVLFLGRDLIGKMLCTPKIKGMITETESYKGPEDRASHSYNMKRTKRNEVMYLEGGHAYVYICYGIHHLFNIVTGPKECPHAILIRGLLLPGGLKPIIGPGNVSKAVGITQLINGIRLDSETIWLEDSGHVIHPSDIEALPRVGIDYAGADALLPWRFRLSAQKVLSITPKDSLFINNT